MKITNYFRIRPGAPYRASDAKILGKELIRISKVGGATAEDILRDASKKGSKLKKFFNWNDKDAAHEHRLEQARAISRAVEVKIEIDGEEHWARAFHAIEFSVEVSKDDDEKDLKSYFSIRQVTRREEFADQVIEAAWRQHVLYREVFGEVFESIEKLDVDIVLKKKGKGRTG